ncbi:hypothetical protein MM440_04760 [Arsenicicoccus piscis]|uniref:Cell division protein FtsL n=1 Tax=Arsenicicoccus piscis TaxID=673954 RepID=A0ABQ6HLA6_9MICO|nr:hypothetical protein [Arsenicicoccus piscis]MCH8627112.1 hypothetical protein [Arsenicicoccus piscis]GMA18937.1 hypothetical protein GCM10025862_09580 [Arsenicicoccus piscis]
MSATTASAAPARAPRRLPAPPALRLVRASGSRATRVPFLGIAAALLTLGLIAVLVLNITLSQGSYTVHDLREKSATLADTRTALDQDLNTVSSAPHLAQQAAQLGLVPAGSPAFIDPATGKVSGVAKPAGAEGDFTVVTGSAALAPAGAVAPSLASATTSVAGLGLGGGLLGALASLPR